MTRLYSDVCKQNMPPANEIMAPLAYTANEMIFAGTLTKGNYSVTVTFSLLNFSTHFI